MRAGGGRGAAGLACWPSCARVRVPPGSFVARVWVPRSCAWALPGSCLGSAGLACWFFLGQVRAPPRLCVNLAGTAGPAGVRACVGSGVLICGPRRARVLDPQGSGKGPAGFLARAPRWYFSVLVCGWDVVRWLGMTGDGVCWGVAPAAGVSAYPVGFGWLCSGTLHPVGLVCGPGCARARASPDLVDGPWHGWCVGSAKSQALAWGSYVGPKVLTNGHCEARLRAWRRLCAGLGGLVHGPCWAGFG